MTNLKLLASKRVERVENVPSDVEDNGHGFTKPNAMRVMVNGMKTLLGKMQNCRALKARVLKARTLKVRTPMTFEMTFDPEITGLVRIE